MTNRGRSTPDTLRVVGAVTLIRFDGKSLGDARRSRGTEGEAEAETPYRSGWSSYRAGQPRNPANPEAAVLAMSFLPQFVPQFVPSGAPHLSAMVALAAIWAVYEIGYYGVYVWFIGRMRALISRAHVRRRLEQVSGGVLVLLGVRMAME